MGKELNENTTFNMSVKTILALGFGIATVIGGLYSLMQQIQEAKETPTPITIEEIIKEIPEAEITRMEFDMKDQMIRQTIITTQEDIVEMKETLERIEDKVYNR